LRAVIFRSRGGAVEKERKNASNENRKHWHNNNQRKPNDEPYIETHLKYFSRPRTTMVIIFPG